jgi:hypothetical protein
MAERDMFDMRPLRPSNPLIWFVCAVMLAGVATGWGDASAQAPAGGAGDADSGSAVGNGADLEHFSPDRVFRILGKDVMSAKGENMGRIVDVLFDRSGKACAAVIDFGGFLGVGTRKIAIDWSALRFDLGEKKNVIALDLGREQLKATPEYKESDKPIPVLTLPRPGTSQPPSDPVR